VIFAAAVDGDCERLKQGIVSSKGLFFSAVVSSTKDPLAASAKAASILFVVVVQSRQKRHFRPDLTISAVDDHIRRLG